jgi:hypothetical protein
VYLAACISRTEEKRIVQQNFVFCADLPDLENALLWSMRAWVIGHCRHADVSAQIEEVLAKLGTAEAAGDLDRFMGP